MVNFSYKIKLNDTEAIIMFYIQNFEADFLWNKMINSCHNI